MLILVTNRLWGTRFDSPAKASRQAHRWLRRQGVEPGEWAAILDSATGAVRKRYMLRNGRVERMQ